MDDILLTIDDMCLLYETKHLLPNTLEIKDIRKAFYVLGIEIQRARSCCLLVLSQETYIERVLGYFNMQICKVRDTSITEGNKLGKM